MITVIITTAQVQSLKSSYPSGSWYTHVWMILPVAGLSMPHNMVIVSMSDWLRLCALGYSKTSQISMQIDSRLTPPTLILSFLPLNLEVHCIAASLQRFDWHSINTTHNSCGFSGLYRPVGLFLPGVASSTIDFCESGRTLQEF